MSNITQDLSGGAPTNSLLDTPTSLINTDDYFAAWDEYEKAISEGQDDATARNTVRALNGGIYALYMDYKVPFFLNSEELGEVSVLGKLKPKLSVKNVASKTPKTTFDKEGILPAATVLASGITGLIGNLDKRPVEKLGEDYRKDISLLGLNFTSSINSFDDYTYKQSALRAPKPLTDSQMGIKSGGQIATSFLGSAASGAAAGMKLAGPLGAGIGAFVMGGMDLIGNTTRNKRLYKEKEAIDKLAKQEYNYAVRGLDNKALGLKLQQYRTMNINAYGGPIGGALDYNFILQGLTTDALLVQNQMNKISSMPNSFMNEFAFGGHRNGGIFSNGLTYIGEGGTHELNPYEGVLMGYDELGNPNLVEEGEYVWNDYVFSNRLKVPKEANNMFGLGGKKDGYTFADAVDFLQKESEERPNDPISARGLNTALAKLALMQELLRAMEQLKLMQQLVNMFALGGLIKNGKHTADFDKIVEEFDADPAEFMKYVLWYLKDKKTSETLDDDEKVIYNKMIQNKEVSGYLEGDKSIEDITEDEAKSWRGNFNDKKYVKGSWYDLVSLGSRARTYNDYYTQYSNAFNITAPFNIVSVDKDGNVTSVPFKIGDKELFYKGSKTGLKKYFDTIGENGASYGEILTAMGYNIDDAELVETGDNSYMVRLKPAKNSAASTNPKKSIYKVLDANGNWTTVTTLDLMEKPEYEGFTETKSIKDEDGNDVFYYGPLEDKSGEKNIFQELRKAPIFGNLMSVIADGVGWSNTGDYRFADLIGRMAETIGDVQYTPFGLYLSYDPLSRQHLKNEVIQAGNATEKNILNNTGLNRGIANAQLLAQNKSTQDSLGDLDIKLALLEDARKNQIYDYNKLVHQMDANGLLEAARAGTAIDQLKLQAITNEAKLKTEEKLMVDAAKAANMSNLFESMSNYGKEIAFEDMIKNNRAYTYGTYGNFSKYYNPNISEDGGFLTIKRRRR